MYAATIGFFDGVHAGHRYLINELKSLASAHGLKSMVITFRIHPRKVLQSDFQPRLLNEPDEKIELLNGTGVDRVYVIDFSPEIAKLSAAEFIQNYLAAELNIKLLLVGHDHRFGHNRKEGFPAYAKYGEEVGMEVVQAGRYSTDLTPHVSSSEIRHALTHGNVHYAADLLGYRYSFTGFVINGYQVGRKIGFPTANLKADCPDKLIPGVGVYSVSVEYEGQTYKGMMNIGHRPTLDNGENISIEVHIIDFESEIYHQKIKVRFIRKIREEQKFASIEALIQQLNCDRNIILSE